MSARTKAGASALGAVLAATALLPTGTASAEEACDPSAYPPQQCTVAGGNKFGAPPILVNKTKIEPGEPIQVSVQAGCVPGTEVSLGVVRITTGSTPEGMTTTTSDGQGGFSTTVTFDEDTPNGVYVLYSQCSDASGNVIVSTVSIVVAGRTAPAGSTSAVRGTPQQERPAADAATGAGSAADDATASAAALPSVWTPPQTWAVDARTRTAVSEAVNLRLAALRTELPAAPATTGVAVPTVTDLTPWFAAGGAALLVLGAAGYRRRTATVRPISDEVSA